MEYVTVTPTHLVDSELIDFHTPKNSLVVEYKGLLKLNEVPEYSIEVISEDSGAL